MEGRDKFLKAQWLGRCARTPVTDPAVVHSGNKSLKFQGGKTCFYFRPIAPACPAGRIRDPTVVGDMLLVKLKVRVEGASNQIFHMYTAHYHADKVPRRWALQEDDSHMVT